MPALFALFGEIAGIFSLISIFNRNFPILCIIFLFVLFLLLIVDKRYYIYIILFFILGIFTTTVAIAPFKNPEIPEHLCGVETQITGKVKEFSIGDIVLYDKTRCKIVSFPTRYSVFIKNLENKPSNFYTAKVSIREVNK